MKRRSKDQDLIDELAAAMGEKASPNGGRPRTSAVSGDVADDAITERVRQSPSSAKFAALYDAGDTSVNGHDDSGADFALLGILKFWTQDPSQLERIMRTSALRRPKWDERRGGTTWLGWSIEKALEGVTETYDWSAEASRPLLSSSPDSPSKNTDDDNNEDPLDDIVWFHEQGEPPEREFLIESVAAKKYTIVAYGAGGVAKSFAVLSAGIAIAGGAEEWLGLKVLDHGFVLYMDFELDAEEQHRRVRDLCAGLGTPIPKKLAYFSALGMATDKAFQKAQAFVEKYRAKAVIIDSMGLAMSGDMDRAKDVIAFHRQYTDGLRALGTTPFVVDHEGKLQAGENRKEKGPTGSAFKSWTTRSVLQFILEEYDEENSALDIRVRQHKTNFKPQKPFGVRFTFEEKKVSVEAIELPDEDLVDEAYVPVKKRIVAALSNGDATTKELAQFTGAETGTIRNKLSELMNEGVVANVGYRGREKLYALVTPPEGKKTQEKGFDSDSLLSSSGNDYRDSTDDDNENEIQAGHSENKDAQAPEAVLQEKPTTVAGVLDDPPGWMIEAIKGYREDPTRWTRSLCMGISTVLGRDEINGEIETAVAAYFDKDQRRGGRA